MNNQRFQHKAQEIKRKLAAVMDANEALKRENIALWEKNDTLERGLEEITRLHEAMIAQIVQGAGGELRLPPVKDLPLRLLIERNDDGSMVLTVSEEGADAGAGSV